MRKCLLWVVAVALCGVGLSACLPSAPPEATPLQVPASTGTPGQLVDEWKALAEDAWEDRLNLRPYLIAEELGRMGPTALNPIIDVIESPETDPHAKVFAVRCLTFHMTPAYMDRLVTIYQSNPDGTARACALSLLGAIDDPLVRPILAGAVNDDERRVWFAARLGLADRGDEESQKRLLDTYSGPETTKWERAEIVRFVVRQQSLSGLDVLSDALLREDTEDHELPVIIETLGRIADPSSVEPLRRFEEVTDDPRLESLTRAALEAIEERVGSGV